MVSPGGPRLRSKGTGVSLNFNTAPFFFRINILVLKLYEAKTYLFHQVLHERTVILKPI
jgi:hypothetical protein